MSNCRTGRAGMIPSLVGLLPSLVGLLPSLDAGGVSYNSEWGSSDARHTRGRAVVFDALLGGRVAS